MLFILQLIFTVNTAYQLTDNTVDIYAYFGETRANDSKLGVLYAAQHIEHTDNTIVVIQSGRLVDLFLSKDKR